MSDLTNLKRRERARFFSSYIIKSYCKKNYRFMLNFLRDIQDEDSQVMMIVSQVKDQFSDYFNNIDLAISNRDYDLIRRFIDSYCYLKTS